MDWDEVIDVQHLVSYVYIIGIKWLHKLQYFPKFMEVIYGVLTTIKYWYFRLEAITRHIRLL